MRPILVSMVVIRVREPLRALRALHAAASEDNLMLHSAVGVCCGLHGVVEGRIVREAVWKVIGLLAWLLTLPLRAVFLGVVLCFVVHDDVLMSSRLRGLGEEGRSCRSVVRENKAEERECRFFCPEPSAYELYTFVGKMLYSS